MYEQFNKTVELIKNKFNAVAVANYDQLALCSNFRRQGYDWHEFEHKEAIEQGTSIYADKQGTRIVACNFEFMIKLNPELRYHTGYNKDSIRWFDDGEFYTDSLDIIIPFDNEQKSQMIEAYKNTVQEKEDWEHYRNNVQGKLTELNKKFEVGEFIYYHFLEVLPPIYVQGGFCCSEPINHLNGKPVYHKLTELEGKYFIELSYIK